MDINTTIQEEVLKQEVLKLAGLELWHPRHPGLEEVKEASQEPVAAEA